MFQDLAFTPRLSPWRQSLTEYGVGFSAGMAGWLAVKPSYPSYLCQVPLTQERSYGQMWPHPAFHVGARIQTQILALVHQVLLTTEPSPWPLLLIS